MRRHIELRNHPNTAFARVCDQIADLILGIKRSIRSKFLQLRAAPALDPEAFIIREMKMESVQLYRRHAIQISFDGLYRHKMPRDIDHESSPLKTRMVFHSNLRNDPAQFPRLHQLQHCLHSAQNAKRIRGGEFYLFFIDGKLITFVLAQSLHLQTNRSAMDHKERAVGRTSFSLPQGD